MREVEGRRERRREGRNPRKENTKTTNGSYLLNSCQKLYLHVFIHTYTHIFLEVKGSLDQFCLERAVKERWREAVSQQVSVTIYHSQTGFPCALTWE